MHDAELTMTEVLHDPMIRLLLRADRISLGTFAKLLENAARTKDLPYCPVPPQGQQPSAH